MAKNQHDNKKSSRTELARLKYGFILNVIALAIVYRAERVCTILQLVTALTNLTLQDTYPLATFP